MKKQYQKIVIIFVLLIQSHLVLAEQLQASLEKYKAQVTSLISDNPSSPVANYLKACIKATAVLDGIEARDPRVHDALSDMKNKRMDAQDLIPDNETGNAAVRKENEIYINNLQPYLKKEFINLIQLQDNLLDRKYFKTEIAKNANFIEATINDRIGFTRANHNDTEAWKDKYLGVSPWEAIFRLEPAVAFHGGPHAAILGTLGLSYTFFPDLDRDANPPSFTETSWSKNIKKTGARLGFGVTKLDNGTKFITGAGMQINIFAFWVLYQPHDNVTMLGIGINDLSKFKKYIGGF